MGERLQKTRHPGIYKTSRGNYTTFIRVNGRRKWKTFGTSVREATAWRADMQSRLRRGELNENSLNNMTFGEFAWMHLGDQLHYEQRTRDATATVLRVHLLPYWEGHKLRSITRRDVQEWIKHLGRQTYTRAGESRPYSPSTVRDVYKHFRKIVRAALADGYMTANPCTKIRLPKVAREEQRFLTEKEVEALVAAMDESYEVMVYVAAYLGLRWEEVSALRPSDLDLEGSVAKVHVRATLPRSDGKVEYRPYGKSDASRRSLKIPEFLRQGLTFQVATYSNSEWAFPAPGGGFLRYENFRSRFWVPATTAAGISSRENPFTFHQLRHTAAAFMVDQGADPLQVMRRMGHSDIRTTYNLYGHLFPDREDELVAGLDERYRLAVDEPGSFEAVAIGQQPFGFRSDRRNGAIYKDQTSVRKRPLTRGNARWT
jgi:integrase